MVISKLDLDAEVVREFEEATEEFVRNPFATPIMVSRIIAAAEDYKRAWAIAKEEGRRYEEKVNRLIDCGLLRTTDSDE